LRDDTHAQSSHQRGGSRRRPSQSTRRGQARSASAIPLTGTSTAPVRWNLSASPLICPLHLAGLLWQDLCGRLPERAV